MNIRNMATVLLCAAVLAGCQDDPAVPNAPVVENVGAMQPKQMVKTALVKRARFSTLHAKAGMRITDAPNDFGLSINTEIYSGIRPDRLRVRATKASVDAFDAVISSGTVAVWIPREKTLFQGKVEDLEGQNDISFRPDDILVHLLNPDVELLKPDWVQKSRQTFDVIGEAIELEEVADAPRWRVYLAPKTLLLLAVEELDAKGEVKFVKIYDRYRAMLVRTKKGEKKTKHFPYRMTLEWPQDQRSLEINFKSIDPAKPLPEGWNELDIPEDAKTRPIAEARIEGDEENEKETGKKPEAK